MRTTTRITTAALMGALALGSLATPAAAANPKITIVQGRPGAKVDVCLRGKESKSGLKYGQKIHRSLGPGNVRIKVYKRDARRCRGRLILSRLINLAADENVTWVITRRSPDKLVQFDNATATVAYLSDVYYRHAADLGSTLMTQIISPTSPFSPAAPTAFVKGDQFFAEHANADLTAVAQNLKGLKIARSKTITTPAITSVGDTYGNTRVEFILVGTKRKNARFVAFQVAAPTP